VDDADHRADADMTEARHDHQFPRYHVRPPTGFVNDPNGPVIVDDEIHLYFQYRFDTRGDSPVHWGHATSRDYVNWVCHEPAIRPTRAGLDADGAWSGNTIVSANQVVAFYSAYDARERYQPVVTAISDDGGYHFGAGRRLATEPRADEGVAHFRDPFVWRHGDGWQMIVGSGTDDGTAVARLYESTDLVHWRFAGPLTAMRRQTHADADANSIDTGVMWECPQLVTIDGVDVLIVSPWSPGAELAQVLTLSDVAQRERPRIGRLDHGTNFYAASVLRDSPFGPLVWGWATEGRSIDWCVEADWSGALTLPRRLALRPEGTVAVYPLPAMESLRDAALPVACEPGGRIRLAALPAQAEVRLALAASTRDKPVTMRIRFSSVEHLDITLDFEATTLRVNRFNASIDPRAHRDDISFHEPLCASNRATTLTTYVDGSVLEVFTDSGRCATTRVYPTTPPPWSIDVRGAAPDDELTAWALRPAVTLDASFCPRRG
jgi:beta-fructofuranosidase